MARYLLIKPTRINKRNKEIREVANLTGDEAEILHKHGHISDDDVPEKLLREQENKRRRK